MCINLEVYRWCNMEIEHKIHMYKCDLFLAKYDNNAHNNWFPPFILCMCYVHTSNYIIMRNE